MNREQRRSAVDRQAIKAAVAARALGLVKPGMVIGLGTGTTTQYFIEGLGRLVSLGLDVTGVPTSRATADLANSLGIATVDEISGPIDLAVDGADEIDPELRLIKGRGGALTREKLVAAAARKFIVIADHSKLVPRLGQGLLPVEVLPFLWVQTARRLELMGASVRVRAGPRAPYITDNGNMILDLSFAEPIDDPEALATRLSKTIGVVEHGIFVKMAHACIIADGHEVRVLGSLDETVRAGDTS